MAYHAFICDIVGSWWSTFTSHDIIVMHQDRPVLFFGFLFVIVFMLNSAFNIFGYALHLFHCIYYDHGSYSDGKKLFGYCIIAFVFERYFNFIFKYYC